MNRLYFGDNLDVLRTSIKDESADLIYLDPPFKSDARYNVLFETPKNDRAAAQAEAFRDTWTWGDEAARSLDEIMTDIRGSTARFIDSLRSALGERDMMAYLVMMTVRLHELRRVLKPSGSIFLHCDPTASHYLKVLMDGVFGPKFFRNEVIWKRTSSHNDASQGLSRFGRMHDVILFYSRDREPTWNLLYAPYSQAYLRQHYSNVEGDGRRYKTSDLTAAKPGGDVSYQWNGVYPPPGRFWAYSRANMEKFEKAGRLVYAQKTGMPRLKHYLDEMPGIPMGDLWDDIPPINSQAQERLGYPTQKPLPLLDRIIRAASNPGDVVFDPFCGCGTTIEAAHRAGRKWIGIDVAYHAIRLIEGRLDEQFKGTAKFQVHGIPVNYEQAAALAERDKYQFQWWANYLFDPHAVREIKKGKDRGIDGELYFPMGVGRSDYGRLLMSVKGGQTVGPAMVRDFRGVLEREGAQLGLFICLKTPTEEMVREATAAGFVTTPQGRKPKLQIVAIQDWFEGARPDLPHAPQLESAVFSRRKRRAPVGRKRPDPASPELPLFIPGGLKSKDAVRHLNPGRVRHALG